MLQPIATIVFETTVFFVSLVCLLGLPLHARANGSTQETKQLARIASLLKRAEANLQSVQSSLSGKAKPPRGAAAKLIARRLQQAHDDLEPAKQRLKNLTSASEDSAAMMQRFNQDVALYQELAAFMKGRPVATSDSTSPAKEIPLGYPHADNLKNVQFTLQGKVENPADQLTQLQLKLEATVDQLSINHRTVANALQTIKEARRQAQFVRNGLAKIPANGQGVAAAKTQLANALASLAASEKYFSPLHKRLSAVRGTNRYPDFDLDRKRLQSLAVDYTIPSIFTENRARAAELYAQRSAAQDEVERISKKYFRLIQQKTNMGKTIQGVIRHTNNSFKKFDATILQQRKSLPPSIAADLAEAQRMGQQAVANQTPLWFTEGIPQRIGWAKDKITLLQAIAPSAGDGLQGELTAIVTDLRQQSKKLQASIIRANQPPADNYSGPDRQEVIDVAKSGWAGQQPAAKILKIAIPATTWARETKWVYSNGTWYFSDRSKLQVRLIVADRENDQQAIDRPVTVIKDHQKGDTMIGVPLRDFDEPLEPGEYFLRKNVG